jgi:hypothetical protein
MATKTNARSVHETLDEGLKSDASILGNFAKVAAFAAAAASGEPLSLLAGVTKVAEAAEAALAGASEVTRRLSADNSDTALITIGNYDKFKAIFFTECARNYIEAIRDNTGGLIERVKVVSKVKEKSTPKEIGNSLKEKLEIGIANLDDAEVSFLFGVEPLSGSVPLFSAYSEWLKIALLNYGLEESEARTFASKCDKQARERFRIFLAGTDSTAEWMRRYLAIAREEKLNEAIEGLTSIGETLKEWTEPQKELRRREEEAWTRYREMLSSLPDLRETMFNEQFGVRKVFVKPEVNYHVAGAYGDTGKPQKSPDIGRLLGALVSTRTTGEDLIILCGGPGSGKSTLCRILAAELASNQSVHPIFIRLRRLKEGSDIGAFIEESLQRLGAISRLSDLREFPNLVIILDGFDELVMASRARLRQFFNILREEHSSGSLRGAKIVVSGRDTLFPKGEGLPNGSHVVTLLPFDSTRVEAWGKKWRSMHTEGPGSTFNPAQFLDPSKNSGRTSPLHHLVTWPLTLHLVARVHTTGLLNLGNAKSDGKVEKAYLYRSILAETAQRQEGQADTAGRLNPDKMREFLRDLAWQMYSDSKDSMDPAEVMPILAKYFKDTTDAELAELADVAVVNSPELSKGEETGFEFVHKSFSEYLVAERMAYSLELVIFRAASFGTDQLTWRMSDEEAIRELSPYIAIRLLTEEVQEMLEPMLGSFGPFLKGGKVSEVVSGKVRQTGLVQVIERLEGLLCQCVSGEGFHTVISTVRKRQVLQNPLETFSNYCAGVVLIGAAAVRQLAVANPRAKDKRLFNCNPVDGAFWKWVSILHSGGLTLDRKLAARLYSGLSVRGKEGRGVDDRSSPIKPGWLGDIDGYRSSTSDLVNDLLSIVQYTQFYMLIVTAYMSMGERTGLPELGGRGLEIERMMDYSLRDSMDFSIGHGLDSFIETGMLSLNLEVRGHQHFDHLMHSLRSLNGPKELQYRLEHFAHEFSMRSGQRFRRPDLLIELVARISEREPDALPKIAEVLRRFR